ncbi:hypothetical protein [Bradyrhizobium sp. LVM 105]|uniref:hypothetical protein n=1 Tax=Bradyrhizobium sp. LVM 105 TaxID=2341115 RepID=UPI000F804BB3|nr:hypothetical protein [Bradyrhizobium sp. LVM 105]RTE91911.1 hypothetical protein D6B98_15980 [Bradyrhizobium sp. LVM 105]
MAGLLDYITNPIGTVGAGLLGDIANYYRNMPQPQASAGGPQYDAMGSFTGINIAPQEPQAPPSVFTTGASPIMQTPSWPMARPAPQPQQPSPQPENSIAVGNYQMPRIGNPDQFVPQQAMTPSNAVPAQGQMPADTPQQSTLPPALTQPSPLSRIFNPNGLIAKLTGNDTRSQAQQNLTAQYEALVPLVGRQKAMLAVLNPEAGKTILAQALEKKNYGFTKLDDGTLVRTDPQTGKVETAFGGGETNSQGVAGPDGKIIPYPAGLDAAGRKVFANEIAKINADAAGGKKTEVQGAAEQFGNRMENAEKSFGKVSNEGLGLSGATQSATGAIPGVGNFLKTENFQKMEQSKREWVTALLRKESGAAIGKDEYTQYDRQFFPQPGDGPGVVAQKAEARRVAMEAMKKTAGPGYKSPGGNTTQSGVSWSIVQ